ncbi:NifU family protein [Mycolicibacter minnesotensis]
MIPMHAVATPDPQRLQWVVTCDRMPTGGQVQHAPGPLGALQDDGTISEMTVDGTQVTITLSPHQHWRARGEEIRVALEKALGEPAHWQIDTTGRTADLTQAVRELLSGPIGELAAAHGGAIELVAVTDDQVRVRTSGACHDCPASDSTLQDGLQHELRRRFGDQITVRVQNSPITVAMGARLLKLFTR